MAIGTRKKKSKGDEQRKAIVNALAGVTEAAYLAAAADGEVTDGEYNTIANLIVERCDGDVTIKQVRALIQACAEALENDGFEARMDHIASILPDAEAQVAALYAASDVILGDDEYDADSEGSFYDDLAEKLEFSEELAAEIWNNQVENYGWLFAVARPGPLVVHRDFFSSTRRQGGSLCHCSGSSGVAW